MLNQKAKKQVQIRLKHEFNRTVYIVNVELLISFRSSFFLTWNNADTISRENLITYRKREKHFFLCVVMS